MPEKKLSFWQKYKTWLIIGVIIVVIIGLSIWRSAVKNQPQYTFDTVTKAAVSDVVSETGNVVSIGQANINSSVAGTVEAVYVSNGQQVAEGQKLFLVKTLSTDSDQAMAQSAYLAAQNNAQTAGQTQNALGLQIQTAQKALFDAQNAFRNTDRSREQNLINPATGHHFNTNDVESAKLAVTNAQNNLNNLQANYGQSDLSIQAADSAVRAAALVAQGKNEITVTAPIAGFVSNLSIDPGDGVTTTGSNAVSPAVPALILTKSNVLQFLTQINEIDIPKLKLGQVGKITVDALNSVNFTGEITQIDTIGTNLAGVISYNVYFSIDNPSANLRANMSGNMSVEAIKHENVLTVANAAIKPYQNGKAVQILPSGSKSTKPVWVPIQVGLKGLERTEVTSGLVEGQQVILSTQAATNVGALVSGTTQ